jgi:hypothetical protein
MSWCLHFISACMHFRVPCAGNGPTVHLLQPAVLNSTYALIFMDMSDVCPANLAAFLCL